MDTFGYISVIFSVIIGLGLSHLLTGTTELFKARRRIKFYWVHLFWVALLFVGHIFLWWTMWNLRLVREWNFFTFLFLLLAPVLLYVGAALLMPKIDADTRIDLRQYFFDNRTAFFSINAAFTALMGMENWLLTGRLSPWRVTTVFAIWFVLLSASAIVKDRRWHAAIALLVGVLFLLFVIMFGLRLGGR